LKYTRLPPKWQGTIPTVTNLSYGKPKRSLAQTMDEWLSCSLDYFAAPATKGKILWNEGTSAQDNA
jgi:hypothetical protein